MSTLKILFIGGTGVISAACARAAVAAGHELHVLTRSAHDPRGLPPQAIRHFADVHDPTAVDIALGTEEFDVVANFVAFEPPDVAADVTRFSGRLRQYVFIGTTSSYQKPALRLPITESTPLRNPYFPYSRAKIACEDALHDAYRRFGFPVTIVRPSFTYDETTFPIGDGWAVVERMRRGQAVVVHGDGSALCTLTHSSDFARTFTALLGDPSTVGDSFHITSDEILSWKQVYDAIATAAGVDEPRYAFVPSEAIARADPGWGEALLGDKTHSAFFDNSKVRGVVPGHHAEIPYWQGARLTVDWFDAHPDAQRVDPDRRRIMDALVASYLPEP